MQRNMVWPIHKKKKQSIETVPKEGQMFDLLDKDFKSAISHVFKELNKTASKEIKESMTVSHRIEKQKTNKNEPIRNSEVKKYSNSDLRSEQEEGISKHEDTPIEIIQSEEQKEKTNKMNRSSEARGTLPNPNICIMGIPGEEKKGQKEYLKK